MQVVKPYEGVELECYSITPVTWFFMGKRLPSNVKVDVNYLKIEEVLLDNAGEYECIGVDLSSVKFFSRSTLIIKGNNVEVLILV